MFPFAFQVRRVLHPWWSSRPEIFLETLLYSCVENCHNNVVSLTHCEYFYSHIDNNSYDLERGIHVVHFILLFFSSDMFVQLCLQRTISSSQVLIPVRTFKRFGEYVKNYGHDPKYYQGGYLPRATHLKTPPDYLPPFIDPKEWTLEAATFGQNDYIGTSMMCEMRHPSPYFFLCLFQISWATRMLSIGS